MSQHRYRLKRLLLVNTRFNRYAEAIDAQHSMATLGPSLERIHFKIDSERQVHIVASHLLNAACQEYYYSIYLNIPAGTRLVHGTARSCGKVPVLCGIWT